MTTTTTTILRTFRLRTALVLAGLALASGPACTGLINGGNGDPGADGGGAGDGGGGTLSDGASAGDDDDAPPVPFEAVPPRVYVTKVKNVLTGLAPTDAEVQAVERDPTALRGLIDTWLATPQAEQKLLGFFANAFQQAQLTSLALNDQVGGAAINIAGTYTTSLLPNLRESFARTVLDQMHRGEPFNHAVTTHAFMMTPAMMALYAYLDEHHVDDAGNSVSRMFAANPAFAFTVTAGGTQIPFDQSVDPASPNYLHFTLPGPFGASCSHTSRTFAGARATYALFRFIGGTLVGEPGPASMMGCGTVNIQTPFTAADFNTWRMITVRPPRTPSEPHTSFFDVTRLRTATELVLDTPRVGFFSTVAFFANWGTNDSNLARVTANQALIVSLGQSILPASAIVRSANDGLDGMHADPSTPCYGCHAVLDPMRQFFRQTYTLNYGVQRDPTLTALSGRFTIGGVDTMGHDIDDYAQIVANHPALPRAWTQKLCQYVNSSPCETTDPEFDRVVQAFTASNLDFRVLVRELLSSPLVTNAANTATFARHGEVVSIARYDHLCAALSNRTGVPNVCALTGPIGALAGNVTADSYSRGSENPVLISAPSLFSVATQDALCLALAPQLVDSTRGPYASRDTSGAIASMVHGLMGLAPSDPRAAMAEQVLRDHLAAAMAQGASASDALRSTFALACSSPSVAAVGM